MVTGENTLIMKILKHSHCSTEAIYFKS